MGILLNISLEVISTALLLVVATSLLIICAERAWQASSAASNGSGGGGGGGGGAAGMAVAPLTLRVAILLPLVASIALLSLYLFFTVASAFFLLYFMASSTWALSWALLPGCARGRPGDAGPRSWMRAVVAAAPLVTVWAWTGAPAASSIVGAALVIALSSLIRLPSLRIAVVALVGLAVYDIIWVFISPAFTTGGKSVMVEVAVQQATNPVHTAAAAVAAATPPSWQLASLLPTAALSMPNKLEIPVLQWHAGAWHLLYLMLGLGDVALPALLAALAFDHDKRAAMAAAAAVAAAHASEVAAAGGDARTFIGAAAVVPQPVMPAVGPDSATSGAKRRVGSAALFSVAEAEEAVEDGEEAPLSTAAAAASAAAAAATMVAAAAKTARSTGAVTTGDSPVTISVAREDDGAATGDGGAASAVSLPMSWRESFGRMLPAKRMWVDMTTLPLFRTTVIGYASGLAIAMFASRVFSAAQPALLWIVPAMLGPLAWHAHAQGSLSELWFGPESGGR